ncbi:MAG: tetratricopeptide repeat protein [Desulfarculaceae bacterium]|nr:tetratricopeptide repeat protein [Desulfarculaceae bacterium]MCF8074347.1 tetratricopeptide repeat protein [Desulfarculaceae bacterium]MCF8103553.1 tetratricopeptide repeat protein [Desulfarculaceae bacterium]MCF8117320.1 tetratricopeptide repeat protein [Desulfarculaceae bacterium]
MSPEAFPRRLSAILSADAAGYSRLMRDDEDATVHTITAYRAAMTGLIQRYRGRVVDSPGDNLLAEFTSVADAVKCAVEIQRELAGRNAGLPDRRRMPFRIGLNLGDVLEQGERIYGDGVNVAARMESLAEEGGICASGAVYDAVEGKIDVEYEFVGEKSVKNIDKPVRVYRVFARPLDPAQAPSQEPEAALAQKPSIAVLPFANMSAEAELEYFCDGISEDVITTLSKLPDLDVIARNSTFVYKGKSVGVKQVGRELGVRYVLEGSVRRGGDRLRITAQLIDVTTGRHLWAERYDRGMEDVFALQDEITKKIVHALDLNLISGEQALTHQDGSRDRDLDGVLKMHQARSYLFRGDKEGLTRCRQICEEILATDPQWYLPYSVLGFAHLIMTWNGWSQSPALLLQKAWECANKCIELNDRNYMGHGLLALLYLMGRKYDQSLMEAKKTIDLAPSLADAHGWYGWALSCAGEPAKAINVLNKAIRLNPFPPAWYLGSLGAAHNMLGEYDKAQVFLKQALAKEPNMTNVHLASIFAYVKSGRAEKARNQAQEFMRIDPEFKLDRASFIVLYKDQQLSEQIVEALRQAGLE